MFKAFERLGDKLLGAVLPETTAAAQNCSAVRYCLHCEGPISVWGIPTVKTCCYLNGSTQCTWTRVGSCQDCFAG